MILKLATKSKAYKRPKSSVCARINDAHNDRHEIKNIIIIAERKDGSYTSYSSSMYSADRIALCEIGKQYAIRNIFGDNK